MPTGEGFVFELNNKVPHRVSNAGATDRVHLVVDVAEAPRARARVVRGGVCAYDPNKGMACPLEADGGSAAGAGAASAAGMAGAAAPAPAAGGAAPGVAGDDPRFASARPAAPGADVGEVRLL